MKRYIIFNIKEVRKELGAVTWVAGASSTAINSYYQDDDFKRKERNSKTLVSKNIDFTTLNLKPGDVINYDGNKTALNYPERTTLTTVSATSTVADRVTGSTAVGEDANNEVIKYGYVQAYVISKEKEVYSYPLHKYVGAKSKNNTTVSLYFERTPGIIDEVILNVQQGYCQKAINLLQKDFKDQKATNDIVINETSYNKYYSKIIGVTDIISSITI